MTWTSGTCDVNGIEIHFLRAGVGGPPVVLLHGLMWSGACWGPVAQGLEDDYYVVMPDARGHGQSSAPPHGFRYEDHAADVLGLVRALDLPRPVLVGHSMGGMTAAVATTEARRGGMTIGGLVLVDPTFLTLEQQRHVRDSDVADQHRIALGLSKADLVAQASARHPLRELAVIECQVEARLRTRMAAFDVLTPPNPDYRELVAAIDVPCLLVFGDQSPVITSERATELRELNSRMRCEQVHGAGHGVPFEQPEQLKALLGSFLRELSADE